MKQAFTIRTAIQAICDGLPEEGYEAYLHQQAAAFARESMMIRPGPATGGCVPVTVSVEFLLEDGWLTLTGHGTDAYSALRNALNVCAPSRTILDMR